MIFSLYATPDRIAYDYMGMAFIISPYVLLGSIAVLHIMNVISESACIIEQCSNIPLSPLSSTTATEERGWPAYHLVKVRWDNRTLRGDNHTASTTTTGIARHGPTILMWQGLSFVKARGTKGIPMLTTSTSWQQ